MSITQDKNQTPQVKCPACNVNVAWEASQTYRPFCSARCKESDFIDWANESHRIAGSSEYEDQLSDTLSLESPQ